MAHLNKLNAAIEKDLEFFSECSREIDEHTLKLKEVTILSLNLLNEQSTYYWDLFEKMDKRFKIPDEIREEYMRNKSMIYRKFCRLSDVIRDEHQTHQFNEPSTGMVAESTKEEVDNVDQMVMIKNEMLSDEELPDQNEVAQPSGANSYPSTRNATIKRVLEKEAKAHNRNKKTSNMVKLFCQSCRYSTKRGIKHFRKHLNTHEFTKKKN